MFSAIVGHPYSHDLLIGALEIAILSLIVLKLFSILGSTAEVNIISFGVY